MAVSIYNDDEVEWSEACLFPSPVGGSAAHAQRNSVNLFTSISHTHTWAQLTELTQSSFNRVRDGDH